MFVLKGNRDRINSNTMFRTNFNSDHAGSYTQCAWIVPPYRYSDLGYTWERQGED
ncbi:hypothetical protein [Chitinophaga agrisoli]|uniref:hypothetical protein n=1 Tax=Chitinophaga agrisoli TaxID=2607653 RepID=UPI001661EACA|nr:hypothetical protein [Chitinophaga agrisoli]